MMMWCKFRLNCTVLICLCFAVATPVLAAGYYSSGEVVREGNPHLRYDKDRGVALLSGTIELSSDAKIVANTIVVRGDARIYTNGFNLTFIAREIDFENHYWEEGPIISQPPPGESGEVRRKNRRITKSLELVPKNTLFAPRQDVSILGWTGIFPWEKHDLEEKRDVHNERRKYAHIVVDSLTNPSDFVPRASIIKLIALRVKGVPSIVTAQERKGVQYVLDRLSKNDRFFIGSANRPDFLDRQLTTLYIESLDLENDYNRIGRFVTDDIFLKPGLSLRLFSQDIKEYLAAHKLMLIFQFAKKIGALKLSPESKFDNQTLSEHMTLYYADRSYDDLVRNQKFFLEEILNAYSILSRSKKFRRLIGEEYETFVDEVSHPTMNIHEGKKDEPGVVGADDDTFGGFYVHQVRLQEYAQALASTVDNIRVKAQPIMDEFQESIESKMAQLAQRTDFSFAKSMLPQQFYDRDAIKDHRFLKWFSFAEHYYDFTQIMTLNLIADFSEDDVIVFLKDSFEEHNVLNGYWDMNLDEIGLTTKPELYSPLKPEFQWNELEKK